VKIDTTKAGKKEKEMKATALMMRTRTDGLLARGGESATLYLW
jgi:hypothetical protein